jgi:hypothetical protein
MTTGWWCACLLASRSTILLFRRLVYSSYRGTLGGTTAVVLYGLLFLKVRTAVLHSTTV